jgi:hypothetical protein
MKTALTTAIIAGFAGALVSTSVAQLDPAKPYKAIAEAPPAPKAARIKITEGPLLEKAAEDWAIIRWTSNNPGGSDEHFGVVTYGTDPKKLTETAKSHIRLNRNHSDTVFRVRLENLKPGTTYYYKDDSMQASGARDGVKSPVKDFTTR